MTRRPHRTADSELAAHRNGWICPQCHHTALIFYGAAPNRLCLTCWTDQKEPQP